MPFNMKEQLRVALLQLDLVWEDPQANRLQIERLMERLEQPVDLLVLPEMFTTGFSMEAPKLAEPEPGSSLEWMKHLTQAKEMAICGSLIIKDKGEFYNRFYLVTPEGAVHRYDKRHTFTLAGEDKVYQQGKKQVVVEYLGWRIMPLICYDLRFPVWARNTSDYDLLIYVANWPGKRILAWDSLLRARAIENMAYCIGVNRVGEDANGHGYPGHSAIYDELGELLTEDQFEISGIQYAVLDKPKMRLTRQKLRFLDDRDFFNLQV